MVIDRRILTILLVLALLLPLAQAVLYFVGLLLTAMADTGGAWFVNRLILALLVAWLLDLVLLLVGLAFRALGPPDDLEL